MITYAYVDNYLHVTPSKEINYLDLVDFLMDFSKMEALPDEVKVLFDLRNAHLDLHLDDINKLSSLAEELTKNVQSIRTAFIVEDPKVTAYTMLYSWMPKDDRLLREHFSTEQAAIEWLNKKERI
ncbi:hypothetical protein [Carboxylicivirga linearis]|uniref:STAS/SEC14 domain-containing protein n=1 Tax=Carboxylicivirga linearis TaxID=1628157 RepID=A0ABS5JS45_9BACT|nr:hypothetical protein [Carboxylicivirga linearis]MBS2097667.1 hypothetical protein [Carboxylicivirga linearis]